MPTIDYGIDLGTTNSCIARCRDGEVRIFQNNDLMNVTPSVVCVGRGGRMMIRRRAQEAWVADPANTQAEVKRWMGFLEHRGDNRLGGKDIDRIIAETLLLEPLRQAFALPAPADDQAAFERLMRALLRHAEQAKIALSSGPEATVELFDLGDDRDG